MLLIGIILFIVSYESVMWGWTLSNHAGWLKRHPENDRRRLVSHSMLRTGAAMASLLSICIWMWWVYLNVSGSIVPPFHAVICSALVGSIQLSHIHFSSMIARYTCLPRNQWPIISTGVSMILCRFTKMRKPPVTSNDVNRCWGANEHIT